MMMKKLRKYLAVLALASASVGAFAFSPQRPNPNLILYGNQNGAWVPVSGSYQCLVKPDICVAQFENNDPQSGRMIYSETGRFVK